ncbi:MAG TPA: hypothetical protein VN802_11935 [Stellaceae bacterium]|nr:hypothetical protein [Stellaceae bacterium]
MSGFDPASLTDALLVVKGAAAPSRPAPQRSARRGRDEGRVRVAMRLEEPRHRRLRLAAAHMQQSLQAVILAALDHYLDRIVPNLLDRRCDCLVRQGASDTVVAAPFRTP